MKHKSHKGHHLSHREAVEMGHHSHGGHDGHHNSHHDGHHLSHRKAVEMGHRSHGGHKGHHSSHHKGRHHSDPMVGGTSEHEGRPWGHGEYANMPQEVRMSEYPKRPYRDLDGIDDTAGRIETDDRQAEVGERHNLNRGMY